MARGIRWLAVFLVSALQVIEEEKREREEAKKRREQAEQLESQRGKDVSDTELMNKMFDFLEDENSGVDSRTTEAFGVYKMLI